MEMGAICSHRFLETDLSQSATTESGGGSSHRASEDVECCEDTLLQPARPSVSMEKRY